MKRKAIIISAIALVFITYFAIFLSAHVFPLLHRPSSAPPFSKLQLQAAIQKAGGNDVLQKEAAKTINNASQPDTINCPGISSMATLIGGQLVVVEPNDVAGEGVPAHVLIRRGSHFDYQFIYIFGPGVVPSTNNLPIDLISGSIYLRNTGL